MFRTKVFIYALAALMLASCSIFTPKSQKQSAIEDLSTQSQPDAYDVKIDKTTANREDKTTTTAKSTAPQPELQEIETRAQIGPFTTEQSASVVIPEFKQILLEDVEIKLPELKDEFHYPVDGVLSSPYGWRHGRMHSGTDIRAPRGTEIHATFDGVVRFARYNGAYGNCIVIRHYNGLETMYAHALKMMVKVNQEVKAGDVIAQVGRTGRATGDHLHFEVRAAGQTIDPKLVIDIENKTIVDKNLYITMREGRIFASNMEQVEAREEQIKEVLSVKYHIVKSGDTLSRIAANNRTTVATLCRMNNISSTSILRIGQRVRVQ